MAIAIDLPVVTPAVTATLDAEVILPNVSTVKDGIRVALPYVPAAAPEVSIPMVTAFPDMVAVIGAVFETDAIFASVYVVEIEVPCHAPFTTALPVRSRLSPEGNSLMFKFELSTTNGNLFAIFYLM
jgi:hypothetical protein